MKFSQGSEICECDKKAYLGLWDKNNPITSSVRSVSTPPCIAGNYSVRSVEDNVDETESLYLSICKGTDVMDKLTLNHCRIVIRNRRNQTETPSPKGTRLGCPEFTGGTNGRTYILRSNGGS